MPAKALAPSSTLVVTEDDLHFKMSKKIAQLTKVIYTLNCRNEDSEERVQWLARNHAAEIARMKEACEHRVSEANAKAQTAERERQGFVKELEERQKTLLAEATGVYTQKLAALAKDIEAKKQSIDAALREAKEAAEARLREELEIMRKTKDDSAANLVQEYNERYNAMLVEQMDARDAMEKELNSKSSAKLDALTKELGNAQAQLQSQLGDKNQALQDAVGKNALLTRQLAAAKESGEELELRVGQLSREKADLQQRLNAQRSSLDATEGSAAELEKRTAELASALTAANSALEQHRGELEQLRHTAEKTKADLVAAENARDAAETLKSRAEHEATLLSSERDALAAKVAELSAKLEALHSSSAGKESELSTLATDLEAAKAQLAAAQKQHVDELGKLRAAHAAALQEATSQSKNSSEAAMTALRVQKEEAERALKAELASAAAAHTKQLEELAENGRRQQAAHEAQLCEARSNQSGLGDELAQLRAAREALQQSFDTARQSLNELQHTTAARAAADTATIQRLEAELRALEQSGASSADAQREALAKATAEWERERQQLRVSHENILRESRERWEAQAASREKEHAAALARANEAHAEALWTAAEDAERRLAEVSGDLSARAKQDRECQDQRQRELAAAAAATERHLRAQVETLERQLALACAASTDEKEAGQRAAADLQGQVTRLRDQMAQKATEHASALRAAGAAADERLAARVAELAAQHAAEVAKLKKTAETAAKLHAAELAESEAAAAERRRLEAEQHNAGLEAFKRQLTKDNQDVVDSLNTMHGARMRELQASADETAALLRHQLEAANGKHSASVRRVEELTAAVADGEEVLEAARRAAEEARQRADEQLASQVAQHRTALERLEAEHLQKLNRIAAEHKRVIVDFTAQQSEERAGHQAMTDQLKAAYDELLHKYKYRESRPEDVELINKLLKDNHSKDKALEKAYNDMKLYKLELINREENYNKVFGRRPVVAEAALALPIAAGPAASRSLPTIKTSQRGSLNPSAMGGPRPRRDSR